jgi:acyl-CoA thioester hydrolase
MSYSRTYRLRWADADANGHVRHSAYGELGAQSRYDWLADDGMSWERIEAMGIGVVLLREELDYLRELRMRYEVRIDLELLAMSPDGGRWKLRQHVYAEEGAPVAARMVVLGGWLDLTTRRLVVAPAPLLELLRRSPRASDFEELPPLRHRTS